MKKTHPAFWGAGWAGVLTGAALVTGALSGPSDVSELAGGYGLMIIGAALYLLAGLKLREHVGRRLGTTVRVSSAPKNSAASVQS